MHFALRPRGKMAKLIYILILVINLAHFTLCGKSLTFVMDTTNSMETEVLEVRANIGQILRNSALAPYSNYVIVPFKDSVEPIFTTPSQREFIDHLNALRTRGGDDCPENSVAAIEAGLRASEKQSTIFVFTDGYAKDANNFAAVEALCKETHSQVIIFLTGHCLPTHHGPVGDVNVYYDIAKACSGALLKWESLVDFREAFRYMAEVVKTDWTNVTTFDKFTEFKQLQFSMDRFTSDVMLVVSGLSPFIEIVGYNSQPVRMEYVVHTRQPLVIRVSPAAGDYMANIRGQGPISVTLYQRSYLAFEFGFSTKSPRNLRETGQLPIGGWTNYILIKVHDSIHLQEVQWLNIGDSVKQMLMLNRIASGAYVGSLFVEQDKAFRFWIVGHDVETGREIKGASRILSPQIQVNESNVRQIEPKLEILDTDIGLVDFETSLTLAAKVIAFPKPEVQWQDETNEIYPSETIVIEIPSVYLSYVTIPKVLRNSTITCQVRNDVGSNYRSIDIFVNRTFSFQVLQPPEDASVEYGSEFILYCEVDAYPEATIEWYLNSTKVDTYTNPRVDVQDDSLAIKEMGFEDIGAYECRASNGVESASYVANIEISGVEAPEIEASETEIHLKPLDFSAEVECRVIKGKPVPHVSWKYKSYNDTEFTDTLPYGVNSGSAKISFESVDKNHGGVYKCIATNIMGEDTRDFNIKIVSPPVIKNSEPETLSVRQGEEVHLTCEVEATPEPAVRWEMSQDDVIVTFDHRHVTDDKYTHHFRALPSDSGNYHCIAENSVGKAERTVVLNVLVQPYIEPQPEVFYANIGRSVSLPCNILKGNPSPDIRWEFTPKDSTTSIKLDIDAAKNSLLIKAASPSNEGAYLCIAENQFGSDSIKYTLVVQ